MPQSSEEPQIPLRSPLKLPYSLCEHIKHSHCPHPNSPTGSGEPERSSSHQGPSLDVPETVVAKPRGPRLEHRTVPGQPAALTCPRRLRQPLDSSPKPPLENFPNFFAALHALASGRSKESQEKETAPAQTPGAGIHPPGSGRAFPAVVSTLQSTQHRRRWRKMRGRIWQGFDAQAATGRPRTDRGFTRKSSAFFPEALRLRCRASHA